MVPLPASLAAHQRSTGRLPAVRVIARAERGGQPIVRWQRLYSGAEGDAPHAAAIAGDGSLLRARNDGGTLRFARVAAPGPGSTFSAWTALAAGLTPGSGVALAARAGEALLACANGAALQVRVSGDNGQGWSGASTVVTEASNISSIAAAYRPNGDACLFYSLAGAPAQLKRLRRTAGTWAAAGTDWTNGAAVSALSGIAALHNGGDFALAITGSAAAGGGARAWAAIMGDGLSPANAWSALVEITEADAASGTAFAAPALLQLRPGTLRAAFRQGEAGPVAFQRALETFAPGGNATGAWAEPWPHEASSAYGLALAAAAGAGEAWATTPSGVWRAALPPEADLSRRLLAGRYTLTPGAARCTLLLDNADGGLRPGAGAALLPGGMVEVAAGYASGAGGTPQFGALAAFIVTSVRQQAERGRRLVTVEAAGGWEAAGSAALTQAWQVPPGTAPRGTTFARLAARAGLRAVTGVPPPSADWTSDQPAVAVTPGEDLGGALRRLLETVTDGVRSGRAGAELIVTGRPAAAAPVESFGGAGHPLAWLELRDEPPALNWVRLQGSGRYADASDAASAAQHGPRLGQLRNSGATSDARATADATAALRRAALAQPLGSLRCPHHAGIELFDPVEVTFPGLALQAVPFRVVGVSLDYRSGGEGARYEATIDLGPV